MRKKIGAAFLIFLFLSWNFQPVLFSAPLSAVPATSLDASKIGVVAAVRGTVKMNRPGKVGEIVKSGQPVYLGDEVSTDEKGNLQVLLLDETVFTIGPNSALVIDKFVYDPDSQKGQVKAKVLKGTFRFVTGKIARKTPSDMQVDLPSGTIGVRGTIVAGQSQGARSVIILLGPGSNTNTVHKVGQITVGNEAGGSLKQVNITRPGFGSVIEGPGAEPTPAFKVPAEQLNEIVGALAPADSSESEDGKGESAGSGTSASEEAGQDTAAAGETVKSEGELTDLFGEADKEAAQVSQDDFEENGNGFFDGVTTVEDLDFVTTGKFHYSDKSVTISGGMGGTYDFDLDINFGDRTIGGSGATNKIAASLNTISAPHTPEYILGTKSFEEAQGDFAVFNYDDVMNSNTSGCANCNAADIVISLVNSDGVVANNAAHSIEFTDNTTPYEGAGLSEARTAV